MKIVAFIPKEFIREAEKGLGFHFYPRCTLEKMNNGQLGMVLRMEEYGQLKTSRVLVADLEDEK